MLPDHEPGSAAPTGLESVPILSHALVARLGSRNHGPTQRARRHTTPNRPVQPSRHLPAVNCPASRFRPAATPPIRPSSRARRPPRAPYPQRVTYDSHWQGQPGRGNRAVGVDSTVTETDMLEPADSRVLYDWVWRDNQDENQCRNETQGVGWRPARSDRGAPVGSVAAPGAGRPPQAAKSGLDERSARTAGCLSRARTRAAARRCPVRLSGRLSSHPWYSSCRSRRLGTASCQSCGRELRSCGLR